MQLSYHHVWFKFICIMFGLGIASIAKASLLNEMQSCQAMIAFVEKKLKYPPSSYTDSDIQKVLGGLNSFDEHIQSKVITPGLLSFNGSDKSKADAMQAQIDTYKSQLVAGFEKRYPQDKLFTDFAVILSNCSTKVKLDEPTKAQLKTSLNTIVAMARSHN